MKKLSHTQLRMLRGLEREPISSLIVKWRTADVLERLGFAKWVRSGEYQQTLSFVITDDGLTHLRARAAIGDPRLVAP
jgi:hypothetical protein